jgi:hypothetical protein
MTTQNDAAQWPGTPYAPDAADLIKPLKAVLEELRVLEDTTQEVTWNKTPLSYQVISAGATRFSRNWSVIVAGFGGAGALASAIRGFGFDAEQSIEAATFTASAALLLGAAIIAIATMVKADVNARGSASAAQYAARASITCAMLTSSQYGRPVPPASPSPEPNYMIKTKQGEWHPVKSFQKTSTGVLVKVDDGTLIPARQIDVIVPTSVWSRE